MQWRPKTRRARALAAAIGDVIWRPGDALVPCRRPSKRLRWRYSRTWSHRSSCLSRHAATRRLTAGRASGARRAETTAAHEGCSPAPERTSGSSERRRDAVPSSTECAPCAHRGGGRTGVRAGLEVGLAPRPSSWSRATVLKPGLACRLNGPGRCGRHTQPRDVAGAGAGTGRRRRPRGVRRLRVQGPLTHRAAPTTDARMWSAPPASE